MPSFKSAFGKSSSSKATDRVPAPAAQLQVPRNIPPYPTTQYPATYDTDSKDAQHINSTASASSVSSTPSNSALLVSTGRAPAEPESYRTAPSPNTEKHTPVTRKNIKSKLGLPGSSREDLEETSKEPSRGLFGRKKSVVRRKEPSTGNLTVLNPQEQQSQWAVGTNQPIQQTEGGFEPYGPDFTTDRQGNYYNTAGAINSHASPQYQNSPIQQAEYNGSQTQFQAYSEAITPSTQISPTRPRLISRENSHDISPAQSQSQQNSRPSSRHSQAHFPTTEHPPTRLTLQEALILEGRAAGEDRAQQLQRGQAGPMPPPHGMRQSRRPSVQHEQAKGGAPIGPPRENSSLHPSANSGAGLSKQISQSTQSSEGDVALNMNRALPQSAREMSDNDIQRLSKDYSELKMKYNNVKRQYFEKKDQVETLQNSLAQQRLSQSRTCLDDGEYISRMTRLDGLVSQLAYGIRKDWLSIPDWLVNSVNKDALAIGKHEMTVVGRAVISRWLADDFFNKYFHPELDSDISVALKTIQKNILADAPSYSSPEDEEQLVAKIIAWRLATAEGLKSFFLVPEATSIRVSFTDHVSQQLVTELSRYLLPSALPSLEGGIRMIIEVAVSILSNLPQESREVCIEYFPPGYPFSPHAMKIEGAIPALPGVEAGMEADRVSVQENEPASESLDGDERADSGKKAAFFGLGGGGAKKVRDLPQGARAGTPQKGLRDEGGQAQREEGPGVVRMSAFLAMRIRGKMVLSKAPVFRM